MYIIWAFVLILQNFSFVLVSRARNSNNIWYHAVCSLASNGVWFLQNILLLGNVLDVFRTGAWWQMVWIGIFYTTFTMLGAISAHYFALRWVEKRVRV